MTSPVAGSSEVADASRNALPHFKQAYRSSALRCIYAATSGNFLREHEHKHKSLFHRHGQHVKLVGCRESITTAGQHSARGLIERR
jgi:hypothetical protein